MEGVVLTVVLIDSWRIVDGVLIDGWSVDGCDDDIRRGVDGCID
jgi:hypothetical protein